MKPRSPATDAAAAAAEEDARQVSEMTAMPAATDALPEWALDKDSPLVRHLDANAFEATMRSLPDELTKTRGFRNEHE